ncbi:hypothetical protein [Dyadobacter tibetensis]|uniref:hypothetical protein n=1 Tax=Dyadobacter tibetensis TaxID=1211851 RepID=UPI000471A620|nr:hypothetical protein [Dyadobacter tibetensis]
MKNIKLKIWLLAMVLFAGFSKHAWAQQQPKLYTLPSPYERYTYYLATARFGGSMPLGKFSEQYIDKSSFRDISVSLEWVLPNRFSIGGEIGSNYYEKRLPRALYEFGDQTVSAIQTRTLSQVPIQVFANYHLAPKNARIQPYFQVSGGISLVDYSLYYGSLVDQYQKIKPTYGVGVGSKFLFKPDGALGADIRIKYSGTSIKYDYLDGNTATIGASVGLFYRWW